MGDDKTAEKLMLKDLIYLWTRDAGMPVNQETEEYVADHLAKLAKFGSGPATSYSDEKRAEMAERLISCLRVFYGRSGRHNTL